MITLYLTIYTGWIVAALCALGWIWTHYQWRKSERAELRCMAMLIELNAELQPSLQALKIARTIPIVVMLLIPSLSNAQSRFHLTPVVVYGASASVDTVSTHWCGGERNPTFQIDGDWRRPNYPKMWAYNALGLSATSALQWAAHRVRQRAPETKTAKALTWLANGYAYSIAAPRALAGVRNLYRCAGRRGESS